MEIGAQRNFEAAMPQRVQREDKRSNKRDEIPQPNSVPHDTGADRADDWLQVTPAEVAQGVILEVVPKRDEARDGDERVEDVAGDEGDRRHEAEALLREGAEHHHEREDTLVTNIRVQKYGGDGQQGRADLHGAVSEAGPVRPEGERVGSALKQADGCRDRAWMERRAPALLNG